MSNTTSEDKIVLLAVNYATQADLASFSRLARSYPSVLSLQSALTILLEYLPETVTPNLYVSVVQGLVSGKPSSEDESTEEPLDFGHVDGLSNEAAKSKVHKLGIKVPPGSHGSKEEVLTNFLKARARAVDEETGLLQPYVTGLVEPFLKSLPSLQKWYNGTVLVLVRIMYETEGEEEYISLNQFEQMDNHSLTNFVLSHTTAATIVPDLAKLLSPCYEYRKTMSEDQDIWEDLWIWMVEKAKSDLSIPVALISSWDGPHDKDEDKKLQRREYGQAAIASCYVCRSTDEATWNGMQQISRRLGSIMHISFPLSTRSSSSAVNDLTSSLSLSSLSMQNLLVASHPVTSPSAATIDLLSLLVDAGKLLSSYIKLALASILELRIQGNSEEQHTLVRRVIQANGWENRSQEAWKATREACLWLKDTGGLLKNMETAEIEQQILKTMLLAGKFALASSIYTPSSRSHKGPLTTEIVEETVLEVFQEFYDTATNGNQTRGGMKNALSTIQLLYPKFSKSTGLTRAWHLIQATHALSQYSITISPGMPLIPVQIRIHPDPLKLMGKLLDSNPGSFRKTEELLGITQDLMTGLGREDETFAACTKVLAICIQAALAEDDFETAYSLTMSRLLPSLKKPLAKQQVDKDSAPPPPTDLTMDPQEIAWQTCFQAGKYQSQFAADTGKLSANASALRILEMRMELLSHAVDLCPGANMDKVLGAWRRCEEQMLVLLKQEKEDEAAHRDGRLQASATSSLPSLSSFTGVPGAFPSTDAGPLGLFTVAAGAGRMAKALASGVGQNLPQAGGSGSDDGSEHNRTRKRDVLGGMVSSGVASGMGWLIGAKQSDQNR